MRKAKHFELFHDTRRSRIREEELLYKKMTDREQVLYRCIQRFIKQNNKQPNLIDLEKRLEGTREQWVVETLISLQKKGFIKNKKRRNVK